MGLKEEFERTGNWLFRRRSYLPLIILGISLAALGSFSYPFQSESLDQLWEVGCLIICFAGLGLRIYTVGCAPHGSSGRNTKKQAADVLSTTGIYSIVRHPLYLGNFLIWFGISISVRIWWLAVIVILIYWLCYERIMFAEEEFLRNKYGKEFIKWAEVTPAFIPRFRNWKPSDLKFSLRKGLRGEYSGFLAIIVSFIFLDVVEGVIINGKLRLDRLWIVLLALGLIVYIVLRFLKKKTRLLNSEAKMR